MSKIKLHQIIAIVGIIIFMNFGSFSWSNALFFALFFIKIPLILHEFIKTGLMKKVQSEKDKLIIVCVMVLLLFFL